MANVGDLAVKGGKAVIKFMLELITEFLKSEEFKKQMKFMVETLVTKVVDKVIEEKKRNNWKGRTHV